MAARQDSGELTRVFGSGGNADSVRESVNATSVTDSGVETAITSHSRKSVQSSRLWVDKGDFWETLELNDQETSGVSCTSSLWHDIKVAKQVSVKKSSILLVPLLVLLVVVVVSVMGITAAANETQRAAQKERLALAASVNVMYERQNAQILEQRLSVEAVTAELKGQLVDGLERAATPLRMVEVAVQENPEYPYIKERFDAIVDSVMAIANLPGDKYSLGIAPMGIMMDFQPMGNNSGAIGHDLMDPCQKHHNQETGGGPCPADCVGVADHATGDIITADTRCWPSRRVMTSLTISTRSLTLDGPITLTQGGFAFIMRHPIFVNTTGKEYNATFGGPNEVTDCPDDICYDADSGMRFWGIPNSLLSFGRWLELSGVEATAERTGMSYSIYDPVKDFTLKISDTPLADDAIQVDVGAYNRVLKLRTSPKDGWMQQTVELQDIGTVDVARPDWEVPLIIGGVVLGIVLAAALAAMLIEKECHQTLLRSMLPVKTLPYVERGLNFCEQFQTVTILFSDIVSYTNMAAQMDPMAVVNMLNELYFMYDRLVEKHNVYKVETIGDAFMCAGGVPDATSAVHGAEAVANMALDMIESTRTFVTSTGLSLQIRVGMHSGPVVGAVIGLKMPHYCLFGDTVNTASRMESNSEAMRTHLSASSFNLLQSSQSDYNLSARGEMDIKGKGKMFTYWLDAPKNQKGDATIVAVTDVNLQ